MRRAARAPRWWRRSPPRSWFQMASTLSDDTAPSASLDCLKARAAPTHPGAQPEPLGSLPWPQELASGRPKVEDFPLSTTRRDGATRAAAQLRRVRVALHLARGHGRHDHRSRHQARRQHSARLRLGPRVGFLRGSARALCRRVRSVGGGLDGAKIGRLPVGVTFNFFSPGKNKWSA